MKKHTSGSTLQLTAATLFWLLPLAACPLAFLRLTGAKVPLFGQVEFLTLPELGLIALAMLCAKIPELAAVLKSSRPLQLLVLTGTALLLISAGYYLTGNGTIYDVGTALFYAILPLTAAIYARTLKTAMIPAGAITAVLLLWSGIFSEKFTGLCGNWNWTQVMITALLPAVCFSFGGKNCKARIITAFVILLGCGAYLYPQELSRAVLAALLLIPLLFILLQHLSGRWRNTAAAGIFILLPLLLLTATALFDFNDSRFQLWRGTAALLKSHWLAGVGPGRFFDFIPEFLPPEYFTAPFAAPHHPHCHNEILNLWSCFGIAGILFATTLWCSVLNRFPATAANWRKLLPFWIFAVIFCCGQLDMSAAIPTGAFWMLAAGGIAIAPPENRQHRPLKLYKKILPALMILLALASAAVNFRATALIRQGELAARQGDLNKALKLYGQSAAIKFSPRPVYARAEIMLHAFNDHRQTLNELQKLDAAGIRNYLHSNRLAAIALANTGHLPEALTCIVLDRKNYPYSIINARIELQLLQSARASKPEIDAAVNRLKHNCKLRNIPVSQAASVTMIRDDEALNFQSARQQTLSYPELFPGIVPEAAAAFFLIAAALGAGALICRNSRPIMVELPCGIVLLAFCGAFIPAEYTPYLLIILAPAGILRNYPKLRRHPLECLLFSILLLLMLGNALLPPNSWDEQVYQIALLKNYSKYGFFNLLRDNPYSAYPSLPHAFLLTAFNWGGVTLPRLASLLLYGITGSFLLTKLRRHGTLCALVILAALLLSPLTLLLSRNFYAEPFILIFAIAGTVLLFSEKPEWPEFLLAGIMAGAAAAVKLTGVGISLALLVLLLFRSFKIKTLLIFSAGALAAAAPFFLRTLRFWGNPFYPYGSQLTGASESAVLVEKFHTLLGGHYGLDPLYGTAFGWLFTVIKPELYDGIDCGFQFPLFFLAALAGSYAVIKKYPECRWKFAAALTALLTAYLFWGISSRQTRFLLPVFFGTALLAAAAAEKLPPLWKKVLLTLTVIATLLSVMKQPEYLKHYYYAARILPQARRNPAGFSASNDHGYADLLHAINQLPQQARIALLTERRTLYMPRTATLLMPHFQEKSTPVPDDEKTLMKIFSSFDYIITRIPNSDVDRAPEYDDELKKLYTLTGKLLEQSKLIPLPGSQMMILRVVPEAAGTALASSSDKSASTVNIDASQRSEEGNPRPRR